MRKLLKPAVPRFWLLLIAGLMWSGVGVLMCEIAYHWLTEIRRGRAFFIGALGLLLALTVYRLGFSRIACKNIERISHAPDSTCVFAFQPWRGYLIVVVMITIGITIRHSAIPRQILAILYSTIGGALFLASLLYYGRFWRLITNRRRDGT